ncbi:MAG: hypothetical protein ACREAY_07940 [Nitrososphaera sp.]|uniref:hypothetical protein n=1 Tax=Nitrososphaera sp. TaxID=1971748 RepID=UPI003D6F8CE3
MKGKILPLLVSVVLMLSVVSIASAHAQEEPRDEPKKKPPKHRVGEADDEKPRKPMKEPGQRANGTSAADTPATLDMDVSGSAAPLKRGDNSTGADVAMNLQMEGMKGKRGFNLRITSGDVTVGEKPYIVESGKATIVKGGKIVVSMGLKGEDGKVFRVNMAGKLDGEAPEPGSSASVTFSKASVARLWKLDVTGELANTTVAMATG